MNDYEKDLWDIIENTPPLIDDAMMEDLKELSRQMQVARSQPQEPPRKTDAQLRKECPAVKDAYEKYKMMLKLARTNEVE